MGQMLTAKQVAEVKGCSYQYVKRIIKEGKLQAQEILNDKNRKTYLVPLEALDEELQQKWYQMNLENPPEEISTPEPVTDKKAVDHFSESERQEIDFWISLVEQWQQYRMKPGVTCKADVDKKFVALCGLEYPDKEISVDILYRKWKAVKDQIYTDEEFEEYVTAVLEWYFNMEAYNGAVEADKGKCKIEKGN